MSENVKITRAETMSQNFRHIVISTHKNVEIARAETMCTFSLRKKFVKKCDIRTDIQTDTQTIPFRRCFSHQKCKRSIYFKQLVMSEQGSEPQKFLDSIGVRAAS